MNEDLADDQRTKLLRTLVLHDQLAADAELTLERLRMAAFATPDKQDVISRIALQIETLGHDLAVIQRAAIKILAQRYTRGSKD